MKKCNWNKICNASDHIPQVEGNDELEDRWEELPRMQHKVLKRKTGGSYEKEVQSEEVLQGARLEFLRETMREWRRDVILEGIKALSDLKIFQVQEAQYHKQGKFKKKEKENDRKTL